MDYFIYLYFFLVIFPTSAYSSCMRIASALMKIMPAHLTHTTVISLTHRHTPFTHP